MVLIHDPLSSPLFVPTAVRLGGLLVAGAVLVAIAERRHLHSLATLRESTLFRRVFSWALMAPTFMLGVLAGGAASLLLVLCLMVQSVHEFSRVTRLQRVYRTLLLGLGGLTIGVAAVLPHAFAYLPFAAFLLIGTAALASDEVHGSYRQVTLTLFGYMYLPILLSFLILTGRQLADGTRVLLLVGTAVALSDIGAFLVGSLVRGRRLAPRISPNKTIAGVAGNVAGSYAGFAVMGFAIPSQWPVWLTASLPALIAVAAIWGDLLESLIKRTFATKDAGSLLPGFGGILDRIDSLIVAVPATYLVLRFIG